ncbi:MAG TPA: histidine triad nucleotide-binding protein [Gammaproteobacteria bacterium]
MTSARNPDCIFCRIVSGDLPSDKLYEDDEIVGFRDIHPQAPFHGVIIPRAHIATLDDLRDEQAPMMGRLFVVARELAREHGLPGYRVVVNTNAEGGQVVYHVHMHLLGGRQMRGELG